MSTAAAAAAAASAGKKTVAYFQSPAGKRTVRIGLLILGGYIAYRILKTYVIKTPQREEVQEGYNELETLNSSTYTKQKITKSQAETYANVLHAAMDGYGTDEQAIYNVFWKLYNDADYLAVKNAYAIRELSSGTWNPEKNFKGTLTGALTSELSTEEKKKINDILRKKKIKYRVG
jgi:hypothetical protein